jgi:putative permease
VITGEREWIQYDQKRCRQMNIVHKWLRRHVSNPQIIILVSILFFSALVLYFFGNILAPVLASIVIAYLLEGLVATLERIRIPRLIAVSIVFLTFMASMVIISFLVIPLLAQQVAVMVNELPSVISYMQQQLKRLPERFPDYISEEQIKELITALQSEVFNFGQKLLTFVTASVRGIVSSIVYLILVPFMVFFFLKDKQLILEYLSGFVPKERQLSASIYRDVNRQVANYVRGKFLEILIIWLTSYITFLFLEMEFAFLMSLLTGLSVLFPYIGVAVVSLPVAVAGLYQWGWGIETLKIMIAYTIIQIIDGNLLAPLLLSGVVNLHPVAIIVAILIFGGLWGFWGVFFAIPLATLVQAIINAWPREETVAAASEPE